jgi:L-rhamnose mutarotase
MRPLEITMKTYCFALDLEDDPELIAEYRRYHELEHIWPEVLEHIRADGVVSEEIYLAGNRLFMILHTTDDFSLDAKAAADKLSPAMQKWEELMWKYQKPLPNAKPGEKWILMEKIFDVK